MQLLYEREDCTVPYVPNKALTLVFVVEDMSWFAAYHLISLMHSCFVYSWFYCVLC